ncbi:hypothetical protein ACI79G_06550 [Geodermatophilus sp. SYSU D00779]
MGDGAQIRTPGAAGPSVGWASGPLGAVQAAAREMSRQAALRVRAVAAFAAIRPASVDRAPGERGAMSAERWAARADVLRSVGEWAAQELSSALDTTTQEAEAELERALTLVSRLPRVLEALEGGLLHEGHLWCLLEHEAPIADDALRTRVEGEVLDWVAARRRVTTPAALGHQVRRVVAALDARIAARDLARALARRGISQLARAFAGPDPTPTPTDAADAVADIPTGDAVTDGTDADSAVGAAGDADAADTRPAATPSIGAVEPVDVEGDPIERAARELSGADFDRWLDELVRDGLGDAPAPGDPGWQPGVPPGPAEWDAGPWCDPCEWLDAHAHEDDLPVPGAGLRRTPTVARPPLVPAGGRRPTARCRTPVPRCTPPGWRWARRSGRCAPPGAPTLRTRPPGRSAPPVG